ncbi:MAG: hypothetical protein ACPL07_04810 [Candidatus Bathyarchaeia archaeon]
MNLILINGVKDGVRAGLAKDTIKGVDGSLEKDSKFFNGVETLHRSLNSNTLRLADILTRVDYEETISLKGRL